MESPSLVEDMKIPEAEAGDFSRSSVEHVAETIAKRLGYEPGDEIIPVVERLGGL